MEALPRNVENRLTAVYQRKHCQRPQLIAVEAKSKAPYREAGDTEEEIAHSHEDAGNGEVADPPNIGAR